MMKTGQSKRMSLLESMVSVSTGYIMTVLIQYWVYPIFGITVPKAEAFIISGVIVFAAFVKNFSVRRLFNFIHIKGADRQG